MDRNKLKVLKDAGYTIPKQCGLCQYGEFTMGSNFGTCTVRLYQHEKHSGGPRHLSVYKHGGCLDLFKLHKAAELQLGDWAKFIDRRTFTRSNRHKQKTSI